MSEPDQPENGPPPGLGGGAEPVAPVPVGVPRSWRGRNPTTGIYGTIICASVIAAVPGNSPPDVVVGVVVTMLVYWLAERYATLLAVQMRNEPLNARRVRQILTEGWQLVEASYTPLLVLLGSWALGADTVQAVGFSLLYTAGLLLVLGWFAGRRSGLTGMALAGATLFTGTLGGVIVLLKLALH